MKRTASTLCLAAIASVIAPSPAEAAWIHAPFFSEYVEGSSYNKAVEIFNGSARAIDLGTDRYHIDIHSNGSITSTSTVALSGTLDANATLVVANARADSILADAAALLTGSLNYNGDDVLLLRSGSTILDVIGRIGEDPGSQWTGSGIGTRDETLRRNPAILAGDVNGLDAFDPSTEWSAFGRDHFDGLGIHSTTGTATPVPAASPLALLFLGAIGLAAIRRDRAEANRIAVIDR